MRPTHWTAANGTPLTMRLARASDMPQVRVSLEKLSPEARRNRFFSPMPGFSEALVRKLSDVDPAQEHALLVMRRENDLDYPVAGGRFVLSRDEFSGEATRCDFALVVGDLWQGQGIGKRIMQALIAEAVKRKLQQMSGHILSSNEPMLNLARTMGFQIEPDVDEGIHIATLPLTQPRRSRWKKLIAC